MISQVANIIDVTNYLSSHAMFNFEAKVVRNYIRIVTDKYQHKIFIQKYLSRLKYHIIFPLMGKFL